MNKKQNKAFTLVELIVVITILAVLGTIGFLSFQGYSKTARDSRRISDINNIKTALGLFILSTGKYPLPDNGEEVKYSGDLLWTQGTVGDNVTTNLSETLKIKPLDPLLEIEYVYSVTNSQKEYQVMALYEGEISQTNNLTNTSYAANNYNIKIEGTYNEVFVKTDNYIVPTPSIINSEVNSGSLILNKVNILSQVVTGGENIPDLGIPNMVVGTGNLDINLKVYTGSLTINSPSIEKIKVLSAIQDTYTGSTLATQTIYKNILNTTQPEILVDQLILNTYNTTSDYITSGGNITFDTDLYSVTDDEIKYIFDTGSPYVENWTVNNCNPATTTIVNVTDATSFNTNINGKTLANNTIYKIDNGTYNVTAGITMGNCSAIIGKSMDGVIFKRSYNDGSYSGFIKKYNGANQNNNIILTGFSLDGNRLVWTDYHNFGLYLYKSSNNTLNNIKNYNDLNYSIYLSYSNNNTINNLQSYDNSSHGLYISYSNYNNINNVQTYNNTNNGIYLSYSNNNTLDNIQSYNNSSYGVNIGGSDNNTINNLQTYNSPSIGTYIVASDNNVFSNIQSYDNTSYGIYLCGMSTNNNLNNIKSYNNNSIGIVIYPASNNNLNNIQSYNNIGDGINVWVSKNNYYNNVQCYNNTGDGIVISGNNTASTDSLNNIQSYNNGRFGINLSNSLNSTLNNVQSYNNAQDGLYLSTFKNSIFNNVYSYNDTGYGFYMYNTATGNKYYGNLKLFGNSTAPFLLTTGSDTYLTGGLSSDSQVSGLGFSNGIKNLTGSMECTYHSQPNGLSVGGTCTTKGKQTLTAPVASYTYGSNILKQIKPVRWNGTAFELYGTDGVDYNTSKKIGEW